MKYLIDTNIFITSKNLMPLDIYPSFWRCLSQLSMSGDFVSSVKVEEELLHGNDILTAWIKPNLPKGFFIPLDGSIIMEYAKVQSWAASNPIFTPIARKTFADVADVYLVATAAAHNMTLVTFEKSNPLCTRRVLIPDACNAMGVECCDLNTALRNLKVTI